MSSDTDNDTDISDRTSSELEVRPTLKTRISVVENMYYQPFGEQPVQVISRFTRDIDSTEQLYQRRVGICEIWSELDTGWVKAPSVIIVSNPMPVFQREPTIEERLKVMSKVVEIGLVAPELEPLVKRTHHSPPRIETCPVAFSMIRPGESIRLMCLQPVSTDGDNQQPPIFVIRCRDGDVKVNITGMPS